MCRLDNIATFRYVTYFQPQLPNYTRCYADISCSDIEYPSWELLGATATGNLSLVNALIQCDETDVNLVEYYREDTYGKTSLIIASEKGYVEIVKQLLMDPQINVNYHDESYSKTSLNIASEKGHVEIVEQLLMYPQIDVNAANGFGRTSLMLGSEKGHAEIVRLLLARDDLDVNKIDDDKDTALILSSWKGNVEIVRLLLGDPNLEVNKPDSRRDSGLCHAAYNGDADMVKLFLEHKEIDVNHSDMYGRTPLFQACLGSDIDVDIDIDQDHSRVVEMLLNMSEIEVNKGTTREYQRGNDKFVAGATPLYAASQKGLSEIVQKVLGHPEIAVNKGDIYEITPLWKASEIGNTGVVKLLLAHPRVDVNKTETYEMTPLFIASQNGNTEVVMLLLTHPDINVNIGVTVQDTTGWNYNSFTPNGTTPIWEAFSKDHSEIVKQLLNTPLVDVFKGKTRGINGYADVANLTFGNHKNNMTSNQELLVAAINGNISKMEEILQDNLTDIDITDSDSRTPLIWASKNGHSEVVRELLIRPKINVNKANAYGDTALIWASRNGHARAVKHLIAHNDIEINQADSGGRTALYHASQDGYLEVVNLLCNHSQINVNKGEPEFGETPLYMAAKKGHFNVVNLLLSIAVIDVNKYTINRETTLMVASAGGHSEILRIILAFATVDVTFETFERKTALFYVFHKMDVLEKKRFEVVELLLRCPSIDIAHRDISDKTALDYAKNQNLMDIIKAFEARASYKNQGHTCCSNEVRKGLQKAAEDGDITMVKAFLLCPGIDLNIGYEYGRTPLFMASMNNHSDVVKILLSDSRIDVNVVVNSGNALYIASQHSHTDIVKQLLNHPEIDVNKINARNGKTALIIAAELGHVAVVKLLLSHPQIQTNGEDFYHKSALEKAKSRAYLRVVKLLLRCPETSKVRNDQNNENGGDLMEIDEAVKMLPTLLQMSATCCLNVKEDLFQGASDGDHRAVRGLLHCPNSDVNGVNDKTRTPLYLASLKGNVEPLKVLLESPFIDVNKGMTKDDSSAFSVASEKGNSDIMRVLLQDSKTDVNKGWARDAWTSNEIISKLNTTNKETKPPEFTTSSGELRQFSIIATITSS